MNAMVPSSASPDTSWTRVHKVSAQATLTHPVTWDVCTCCNFGTWRTHIDFHHGLAIALLGPSMRREERTKGLGDTREHTSVRMHPHSGGLGHQHHIAPRTVPSHGRKPLEATRAVAIIHEKVSARQCGFPRSAGRPELGHSNLNTHWFARVCEREGVIRPDSPVHGVVSSPVHVPLHS